MNAKALFIAPINESRHQVSGQSRFAEQTAFTYANILL